jgi:hypothetical protein
MFPTLFSPSSARACLFLYVRTHSQLQYYLNITNSRRAANEGGLVAEARRLGNNVIEIHPLNSFA